MQLKSSKNKVAKMETKKLIGFRTIKRDGETVRIPVYKKKGRKDFIQKSIKHPGRVREIIEKWYGSDGFDSKGRIKPEYLIKAKQKAKEEHNRSLEDAIDLAARLKGMNKAKPYGEPKDEAKEEVEKLREEGFHARLEQTNRNKDLYAPYEGVLPESNNMPANVENVKSNTVKAKLSKAKTLGKPVDVVLGASGRADGWGNSVYIAKITGTDPKYRFQREFLNAQTFRAGRDADKVYRGKLPSGTIIEIHEGKNKFLGIVDARGKVTNWQNEDSIEVQKKYDRILRQREKYGITSQ